MYEFAGKISNNSLWPLAMQKRVNAGFKIVLMGFKAEIEAFGQLFRTSDF